MTERRYMPDASVDLIYLDPPSTRTATSPVDSGHVNRIGEPF